MSAMKMPPSPITDARVATANEAIVLLRFEGLHKSFGGQTVLDGVSGEIRSGEAILLRGDNGAGKTTLIDILTGNLEPDRGAVLLTANGYEEDFRFPRRWGSKLLPFNHFTPERVASEGVGRTWQEIRLFGTQNLLSNIAVARPGQLGENPVWAVLRPRAVHDQEREILGDARHVLDGFGLAGREHSSADMVSLGQAKRVAIARALQAGAKILFLDEPLAGLDAKGIADVMELLRELAHLHKLALVIVEHALNIPHILNLASTVWTLDGGRLLSENPNAARQESCGRADVSNHRHISSSAEQAQTGVIGNELSAGAFLVSDRAIGTDGQIPSLEVRDLVVYRGKRLVIGERAADGHLRGLSFRLEQGQRACLLAPNGWGKTTLLESLAGLVPIAGGTILLNGREVQDLPPWERARLGLSLAQARGNSFPQLRVREVLRLLGHGYCPAGLIRLLNRRVSHLSSGESRMVALLCALHQATAVALLDEPHLALDHTAQNDLDRMLQALSGAALVAEPRALPQHQESRMIARELGEEASIERDTKGMETL